MINACTKFVDLSGFETGQQGSRKILQFLNVCRMAKKNASKNQLLKFQA
jgi:hypothetical protein